MSHEVLLYYRYTPIRDPGAFADGQRELCRRLDLRGRIIVAAEGINGTVSGRVADTSAYRRHLGAMAETAGMSFRVDPAAEHVFPRLSVKVRPELVTLGLPDAADIDPRSVSGTRLSPAEFRERMREPGVLILDGRNDYESDLGRFRGAVCPDVGHFRDLPAWIAEHLADEPRDRPILTYCTGGIRCEKLSGYLKREGFTDVAQLAGGIVDYGRDAGTRGEDFEGRCYVFDERIDVPVNHANPTVVSACRQCRVPCERYVNCALPSCNRQHFCCPACEEKLGRYCGHACRERHHPEPVPGPPRR